MTSPKQAVDTCVQQVLDDLAARAGLSAGQIRTALAQRLATAGVDVSADTLEVWSRAIAAGERLTARTDYR